MGAPASTDRRGQLYLDFVVGISVFVLAIAFVLSFAPGMFSAFADDPSRTLVADRTADRLSGPMLGVDGGSSQLNATCVGEFFTQSGGDCGFDHGASLTEQVGINSLNRLNVSLTRPVAGENHRERLCIEGDAVVSCVSGSEPATVGTAYPAHDTTTTTAFRTVYVDGRDATLVVRVW